MPGIFEGYTDAFAGMTAKKSPEDSALRELKQKMRKIEKKNKQMKQALEEQRAIEALRASEKVQKKEKSFWAKVGDAVVKAIPGILKTIASAFVKMLFFGGKKRRYA